jgi:DNA-binding NtrC family response regulator
MSLMGSKWRRAIQQKKVSNYIPAIVMSASLAHFQQEIEQRHLSGLAKPFSLDDLSQAIAQVLSFSPHQG